MKLVYPAHCRRLPAVLLLNGSAPGSRGVLLTATALLLASRRGV
jgi:hypothetical protein